MILNRRDIHRCNEELGNRVRYYVLKQMRSQVYVFLWDRLHTQLSFYLRIRIDTDIWDMIMKDHND
jgi:hypothetical protein